MMRSNNLISKTPLFAAFFCLASAMGGCRSAGTGLELPLSACDESVTPVAEIQGTDDQSPLIGQSVITRGIVTLVHADTGVFFQQLASDSSPDTSDGLFAASAELADAAIEGDEIVVTGTVAEIGERDDTLTTLSDITGYRTCARGMPLPVSNVMLPMDSQTREAQEGMNLILQQSLAITDVYRLDRGQLSLSLHRILPNPTEVARPGPDARAQSRKNRETSIDVLLHDSDTQSLAVGTGVMAASGVFGHDGRGLRLMLKEPLTTMPRMVHGMDAPRDGDARIVGLNLHNYFNGNGRGGDFPTPRGAETPKEFEAQRARLAAQIAQIRPHVVAVMELENDGFGEFSAARDFIADLQGATEAPWDVVNPGGDAIGGGWISVGIFYRSDQFETSGAPLILTTEPFQRLSRQPLAQWFRHRASGEKVLVVVNHLKSKGSCPDEGPNRNLKDGQGCWNPARLKAAQGMAGWVNELLEESNGKALILGDMNAYRMEDPIRVIIDAGFKDLTASAGLQMEYSYVYRGEAGTLDYAFASPALAQDVWDARILNFNSPFAPSVEPEQPWLRASDHDPVVVDLRFRQAETSD